MPGWLTDHFLMFDFRAMAFSVERRSARKWKTKNGRLASLASNSLVTVPILELWAKLVNIYAKGENIVAGWMPPRACWAEYMRRKDV